jgi:hypothetical protein
MGLPTILAHKAATGLKGGAQGVAQAGTGKEEVQPFGGASMVL